MYFAKICRNGRNFVPRIKFRRVIELKLGPPEVLKYSAAMAQIRVTVILTLRPIAHIMSLMPKITPNQTRIRYLKRI